MIYYGDITTGKTLRFPFNTASAAGAPITLGGAAAARVYKDGSLTEDDSGITVSVDHDGIVGAHVISVDTSADGTFYAALSEFFVMLTVGTVSGTSIAGLIVGSFSIQNRWVNADAVLDHADAIEVALTVRGALRLIAAACAGKASGLATATAVYRNAVADTKPRITATVDVSGNRTAVTTDVA